jgi:hypothetical protein
MLSTLSRRDFCILSSSSALLAMPLCAKIRGGAEDYRSTLVNGYSPPAVRWEGRSWRCNMGSTWQPNMDHCLRLTSQTARFEIRDSPNDHSQVDKAHKRRSELSGKLPKSPALLPNDVVLWSAMSFIHHAWDDPAGMARLWGGVHGQIHMGRTFGGSPAVAFRRTADGQFTVTTRGQRALKSTRHFVGPIPFGRVHDLVFRVILHPTNGSLAVWLDGHKIVDVERASIGSEYADTHWNIGCYYAGGVTCPVVAEYANVVYPGTTRLDQRITSPAVWPRELTESTASQFFSLERGGETYA